MDLDINWLDLPVEIWEMILCNLEIECLLNASISCKQLNDVLSISQRLMKKISLRIENPFKSIYFANGADIKKLFKKSIRELNFMKKCLQKSERKYESIRICDLEFSNLGNHEGKKKRKEIYDILKQFAGSVKQITLFNTSLQNFEFSKIIQMMKNLKVLKFEGSGCVIKAKAVTEIVRPDFFSAINEIYIKDVKDFSLKNLRLFVNLTTLDIMSSSLLDFVSFTLIQINLKVLRWSNLILFVKLTNNFKFSLDELTLNNFSWNYHESTMKFFKSQKNLKKLTLNIDCSEQIELDELLIHLFGNNLQLKTLDLSTSGDKMGDLSYLEGIVNPSVEHLELDLDESQNATELIAAFTKLFPNVKNFHYKARNVVNHGLEQIQNWKYLESINCNARYINSFLENVNSGKKLTTCIINCFYVIDIRKPLMIEFLNRHQNIKHMTLNPHYGTTAPDEILSLIVNTSKSLKTLMYNGTICSLSDNSENPLMRNLKISNSFAGIKKFSVFRIIVNNFFRIYFYIISKIKINIGT